MKTKGLRKRTERFEGLWAVAAVGRRVDVIACSWTRNVHSTTKSMADLREPHTWEHCHPRTAGHEPSLHHQQCTLYTCTASPHHVQQALNTTETGIRHITTRDNVHVQSGGSLALGAFDLLLRPLCSNRRPVSPRSPNDSCAHY